jgi:hypothetical protein
LYKKSSGRDIFTTVVVVGINAVSNISRLALHYVTRINTFNPFHTASFISQLMRKQNRNLSLCCKIILVRKEQS